MKVHKTVHEPGIDSSWTAHATVHGQRMCSSCTVQSGWDMPGIQPDTAPVGAGTTLCGDLGQYRTCVAST
eukprot:945317-Rhodomonas_salina.5